MAENVTGICLRVIATAGIADGCHIHLIWQMRLIFISFNSLESGVCATGGKSCALSHAANSRIEHHPFEFETVGHSLTLGLMLEPNECNSHDTPFKTY
jgi:hypothetical protein